MSTPAGSTLSDEARALLAYWRACRGDAVLPHREHISPVKLRRWIGDVSVLHVHEGEKRFYVALHGENVVRHVGPGFNRQYLEDVVPSASRFLSFAPYLTSIEKRVPVYLTMTPDLSNGLVSRLTRLAFPFCDSDSETVSRFLVYVEPDKKNGEKDSPIYSHICAVQQPHEMPVPFPIYDDFIGDEVIPDCAPARVIDADQASATQAETAPSRRNRLWGGLLGALERR